MMKFTQLCEPVMMDHVEDTLHTNDQATIFSIGLLLAYIFKYVREYVRRCDSCQRMGKPLQSEEMPLQTQLIVEPFENWALYFVGPIKPQTRQKSYILVCTDYVTKWVEPRALPRATEHALSCLLYAEIFTRFVVPKDIVTDGGPQFTSRHIKSITERYHIKNVVTSPPG